LHGDDDWKALLTSGATNDAPQAQNQAEKRDTDAFQALPPPRSKPLTEPEAPEAPEPYGLIDEYVDDLLGIPPEERPSWQRPSWHQTGSSMDVPEMVLQDGSRAPALPASENRASQTPTHLVCSQRNSEMPFLFFFFFLLLVSSHFN
jgi:hypothetical protein